MISSAPLTPLTAATASSDEIDQLSEFLTPYLNRRPFCKGVSDFQHAVFPKAVPRASRRGLRRAERPPYHYLKAELSERLGEQEATLVRRVWQRHQLGQFESQPARLRPALRKLFATAARLAAPKDAGGAVKAILQNFERQYFKVNDPGFRGEPRPSEQRLGLLALIRTGDAGRLLESVLCSKGVYSAQPNKPNPSPSNRIDDDLVRLRREFLLEAAHRAGDWGKAYRQGRLLKLSNPRLAPSNKSSRQFREACRQLLLRGGEPPSKQKQLLVDIASTSTTSHATRVEFALRASASTTKTCRPGELELILCQLLAPSDPRWQINLRRLYRHRPMAFSWLSSLRKLWHHEPGLRAHCRVLFSLLKHSRHRAEAALVTNGLAGHPPKIQAGQLLARLNRACEAVQDWSAVVGQSDFRESPVETGYPVQLPADLRDHILKVSRKLGETPPVVARVVPQFQHVEVTGAWEKKELLISPCLFSVPHGEAKFIVARALFRHVCGLDRIQRRTEGLGELAALSERAAAHCEWMGHDREPWNIQGSQNLVYSRPSDLKREETQVALEELYWQTGDDAYLRFSKILNNRCWCPQGEFEADLFASSFCDSVSASYGVLATTPNCQLLYRQSQRSGLTTAIAEVARRPVLALRLQNLWMSGHEELQKQGFAL